MKQNNSSRVQWRENLNAVELGFDFYLGLLERRLKGEDISTSTEPERLLPVRWTQSVGQNWGGVK